MLHSQLYTDMEEYTYGCELQLMWSKLSQYSQLLQSARIDATPTKIVKKSQLLLPLITTILTNNGCHNSNHKCHDYFEKIWPHYCNLVSNNDELPYFHDPCFTSHNWWQFLAQNCANFEKPLYFRLVSGELKLVDGKIFGGLPQIN